MSSNKVIPGENLIAATSEDNGEISCTVEETNRIRTTLGLKPLTMGMSWESKEKAAIDNYQAQSDKEKKVRCIEDIKERIEKTKEKRIDRAPIKGVGLADVNAVTDTNILSTVRWVMSTRSKQKSENQKHHEEKINQSVHPVKSGMVTSNSYSTKDLEGLSVKHDVEDIQLGDELILTLADSDIITKDDFNRTLGLNENEDILENVVMKDNDNRIVAEKRKKRATQAIYNSYDDEEFAEGAVVGRKRNLLSQYDEQNWTGEAVNEKPKFRIARNNTSNSTSKSINGGIMPSNEALKSGTLNAESITGDYFTIFDYANFKTNRKKVKKLRKARLKESHEATEEHKVDSSKNLIGCKNGMNILGPNMESKFSTMDGGDDADLTQSLLRARRIAQLRCKSQSMEHGAEIASFVAANRDTRSDCTGRVKSDMLDGELVNAVDADGRRPDGTLLFSSASEFTTRLLSRLHENVRDRTNNAANELKMMEQTRNISNSDYSNYQDDMEIAVVKNVSTTQEDSKIQHYNDLVYEAPWRGESGLAATLKQLRGSNVFNNYEDEIGRTTDERMKCRSNDVGVIDSSQDMNLEYRDSKGRKLTPKEAYRQLCYNFHGYGPGKAKLEKRKEKEEATMRTQSNPLFEMGMKKSLLKAQEATGKAHMTMASCRAGSASGTAAVARSMTEGKGRTEKANYEIPH